MMHRAAVLVAAAWTAGAQFPPGYVDPEPVLAAATRAIGADRMRCVTVSGTAYTGMVGQQRESGWNIDWPKGEPLTAFKRTMNWEAGFLREEFDRKPGLNPASWKYGQGWRGGTATQRNSRQIFAVNGRVAWHIDGPGSPPVAAPPEDAERRQLDLWMNPPGFLKAARLPGANPRAVWRWELGESGRDGATTKPEKMTVVSITMLGKYRVDATINGRNLLQRIHTWVPDPVLGDMNYEHEFTDDAYVDLGGGMRFPAVWHHHDGWDDNYGAQSVTAGHNGFGGPLRQIQANACPPPDPVPPAVRAARFEDRVDVRELAKGVWLMGGGSHNSVAVEFDDYVAVVEAPLDERRSLAVIEETVKRVPAKPIRFVVNTHQHFDHIGGLRTYMHIGATIVTHAKNLAFYTRDVLNYAPRTLAPDMLSLWPPTELAEGYQYEAVRENYILGGGDRYLHVSYVQPLAHVEGMLAAWLPKERILVQADLLDTHEPLPPSPTPSHRALYEHVKRLGIQPLTVVPIHGAPMEWPRFAAFVSAAK